MKRFVLMALLIFAFIVPKIAFAQTPLSTRYTACDLCGYCPDKNYLPGNWKSCARCLYPDIVGENPNASTNDTIRVNEETNEPPTAKSGHYYTMIGCLSTDLADFTAPGAAGAVTQTLLTLIFRIAGGIAFLYLMYGAFLIITSQGDAEKLNYGKRVITGAIVGLIFSLSALLIVSLIASQILRIPGFSPGTPLPAP